MDVCSWGRCMTITLVRPDSVIMDLAVQGDAFELRSSTEAELPLGQDASCARNILDGDTVPGLTSAPDLDAQTSLPNLEAPSGMTEADTVSVLEVLDEMQRIIDRHLEKTARQQSDC